MSKQELSREEWEEATRELRKEFERRLHDIDKQLAKGLAREQDEIDEEGLNLGAVRQSLNAARGRMTTAIKRGDDLVTDHPLLVVGGALAVGVLIGALVSTRGKED